MNSKKATIYTGRGDDGTTSLIGGTRVRKDHIRVEAYGTLDELNAHLGLLATAIEDKKKAEFIERIEQTLLTIGYHLADEKSENCLITEEDITHLERAIDSLEASLPAMRTFILPGGTEAAARANLCRTVCRRAERAMTTLNGEKNIAPNAMVYVNRLSDYLFLLQRELCGGEEKKWEKPCK